MAVSAEAERARYSQELIAYTLRQWSAASSSLERQHLPDDKRPPPSAAARTVEKLVARARARAQRAPRQADADGTPPRAVAA